MNGIFLGFMRRRLSKFPLWILAVCALFLVSVSVLADIEPSETAAKITAQGAGVGVVRVTVSVSDTVTSKDNYLYLFEVNAYTDKPAKKLARAGKPVGGSGKVSFTLRCDQNPAYVLMKYCVAVKTKKGNAAKDYTRISPATYVKNPEKAAFVTTSYKRGSTKKGLQTTDIDQLVETGSKNCFFNLSISTILSSPEQSYSYNGTTYWFNPLHGYVDLVSKCNQKGIQVTMQIMLDAASPNDLKANGGSGGAAYYAFQIKKRDARQETCAIFSYLASLFGRDSCFISNWILGNEVNSSYPYYYMGDVSMATFVENYATTFRDLYNAVRGYRGSSRVFICLEHCWTITNGTQLAFTGKGVLESFHRQLGQMQPGINWNLAYHAYPNDLRNPAHWKDNLPQSEDAPVISPKNLRTLTRYMQKTYGKNTRILISEIGFNSGAGEDTQAAGLALAYYIAACNPMIDAFHVRAYKDEAGDAAHGVTFGIHGKKAFGIFKAMDTKGYLKATKSLLKKQVGSNWTTLIPGYKASRMYANYHN